MNTKYFHGVVKRRMKKNEILCLTVNGEKVIEFQKVKRVNLDHFKAQLLNEGCKRELENLMFNQISEQQNERFVEDFS